MTFERKSPGDPLRIPASDMNRIQDATRRVESLRIGSEFVGQESYPTTIARVRNASAQDFDRFDAVGLEAVIILPTDNLPEFQRQPAFDVTVPATASHKDKFAILLEPLAQDAIGSALIAGCAPCRVTGASGGRLEIANGSTVLQFVSDGSARLLWAESGSGERWAIVRLGNGSGGTEGYTGTQTIVTAVSCNAGTLSVTTMDFEWEDGLLKSVT